MASTSALQVDKQLHDAKISAKADALLMKKALVSVSLLL